MRDPEGNEFCDPGACSSSSLRILSCDDRAVAAAIATTTEVAAGVRFGENGRPIGVPLVVYCAACGEGNREEARFCAACGARVGARCAACDRELVGDPNFCDSCGARTGEGSEEPAQTRKVVTLVFADLVGSTSLQEQMDPESVRGLMHDCYGMLRAAIEASGGHVVKFVGDGVMAVFGVPEVAEDDALRAVTAAARMVDAIDELAAVRRSAGTVGLALRVGVNTGEVVVAADDTDVVGDVVNVAARLQAAAPSGGVLVGEATWRLTRHAAVFEALAPLAVRGRVQPVVAHRLVEVATPDDLTSPGFVGRRRELQTLVDAFDAVAASRSPRLVSVIGSPGVGKTRLVREFEARLHGRATIARAVCRARGVPTLAPIPELLDGLGSLDSLLAVSDDAARVAEQVHELASGEIGSAEGMFWAVRRLIEQAAERGPVVVVIEDLHRAESLLLDLVEHLAYWIREQAVLVITTARPELRETRPSLTDARSGQVLVALEGLDRDTTEQLVCELLDTDRVPSALLGRLASSTQGNPLFVREMIRMLVDDDVLRLVDEEWALTVAPEAIEVPPTIQSLLAARVDRLSADERTVLERASVVGAEVYRGALEDLVPVQLRGRLDGVLESLRRKEFLEPSGSYWGDERVLRFQHALIRDAAYRRILREVRARLHERVARWLDAKTGGAADHDEAIGHHLEQAQADARTLGPLDERSRAVAAEAARRLAAAAERALGRDDLQTAASLAERAIACLDAEDPAGAEVLLTHCEALLGEGRVTDAAASIDQLGRLAVDNPRLDAWTTCFAVQQASLVEARGLADAVPTLVAAAARLAELDDRAGEAKAHRVHASVLARLGQIGECEAALDRALSAARLAGDRHQITGVLSAAPVAALWGPSPVPRAGGRCLDVIRLVRITTGARAVEITSIRCQAVLEALRGRFDAARSMLGAARAMSVDLGLRHGLLEVELSAGLVELYAGDAATAEGHLRIAYDGLLSLGVHTDAAQAAALRARAAWLLGRADDALAHSEDSEHLGGQDRKAGVAWRAVRADILAARGAVAEAIEQAEAAVALADRTDALVDHADACAALSRVLAAAGSLAASDAAAQRARALYLEKGATALVPVAAESEAPGHAGGVTSGPEPSNIASRVARRTVELAAAGRFEELAMLMSPAHRQDDRRAVPITSTDDPDAFIEPLRAIAELGIGTYRSHVLAIRGEQLALVNWQVDLGPVPVDLLVLWGVDAAGRNELAVLFDPSDLVSALDWLNEAYLQGEGAPDAGVLGPVFDANRAYNHRQWDRFESIYAPDFVMVDNRPAGWGVVCGPAAFADVIRPLVEAAPDLVNVITCIRPVEGPAVLATGGVAGRARHGGPVELAFHLLYTVSGGAIATLETFAIDSLDAAMARRDELAAARPGPTNAATRVLDRWADALGTADLDTVAALYAEDLVVDDRRPGLRNVITGRAANVANTGFTAGIRPTIEVLGTHGERVALVRVTYTTSRIEGAYLSVVTVDAPGECITRGVLFEPRDVEAARRVLGHAPPSTAGRG